MPNVFICYARDDMKRVKTIVNDINGLGFDYWMDTRNIQSGKLWAKEISDAILACDQFLLFMSKASMESDNVRREVQLAFDNRKPIILLRLEDVKVSSHLKYLLAGIQWVDNSLPDWKSRLAIALGQKLPASPPQKPVETPGKKQAQLIKSPDSKMMSAGIVVTTSILYSKANKYKISNISTARPEIQVEIFKATLIDFNNFFDIGDLRRLSSRSFKLIIDDILRIIKGLLELKQRSQVRELLSIDGVLESLRNARDNLQIANGMFSPSGHLDENKVEKFFARLRKTRSDIDQALHFFTK